MLTGDNAHERHKGREHEWAGRALRPRCRSAPCARDRGGREMGGITLDCKADVTNPWSAQWGVLEEGLPVEESHVGLKW